MNATATVNKQSALAVPGYAGFGGKHCETGALKNVLAHLGVRSAITGQPLSEELLLGIGGGIGMAYWLFEFGGAPFFFIGTRYAEKGPGAEFQGQICTRLGIPTRLSQTASAAKGEQDLKDTLKRAVPAIVWGDMPYLSYLGLPPGAHFGGHSFVVYGIDEAQNRTLIADRAAGPVSATLGELRLARGSTHKPFPPKHKLLAVEAKPHTVASQTLERAVLRGISDCCRRMLNPPISNFGLEGLLKWASLATDEKSPKGWPKVFRSSVDIYGALMSTYMFIEVGGTGGSAFRSMYACFLREACTILKEPRLGEAATHYDACARLWSELARAALPDAVPLLGKTRSLLAAKNQAFEQQRPDAPARMAEMNRELDNLLEEARSAFPLGRRQVLDLYAGLRRKLVDLHAAEQRAIAFLQEALH